nr:50S ribosomal protein L30 [Deinobacterium chartae]
MVRSTIGRTEDQIATVKALGLKRLGDSRELPNTDAVKGMVNKVKFLLEVEE